jgi:DNA polymerase-1
MERVRQKGINMNNRWLLLDVSYLCWRVFHSSLSKLSYKEIPTGVMFGFIRDLVSFQDTHATTNVAFCFDSHESKRKKILPTYKGTREEKRKLESKEEQKARMGLIQQIEILRTSFLKDIGFRNVFHAEGYEADDVIASICQTRPDTTELIIISSDKDLLQLLEPSVSIWEPGSGRFTTDENFVGAWGIQPHQWPTVKAIAGCNTDDIPGIAGVGEKIAAKFIKRELNKKTKTYAKIIAGKEQARANIELVKLPFKGTPRFKLRFDKIDPEVWRNVLTEYGMRSLRNTPPKFRVKKGLHDG